MARRRSKTGNHRDKVAREAHDLLRERNLAVHARLTAELERMERVLMKSIE